MNNYFKFSISAFFNVALIFLLSLLSVSFVQAEDDKLNKIDEIIVVSSKVEQPLREVGTSVSVLTGTDLTMFGSFSLTDALRTLPSVNVSNSGGTGKSTTLRIRGEEGYRTMVLVDGMDVADPSTPQTLVQIDQIMTAGIGRVELLRGPQGMMYGADSGGVVNISTQQLNDGFSGSIGGQAGRYETEQVFGQLGYADESTDFYLSAVDYQTDGFNASTFDTSSADKDGYDNSTYHARLTVQPQDKWLLKAVLRKTAGENQYDNCFNVSNNCANHYDQLNKLIGVEYENENFLQDLTFQINDIERENFSDDIASFDFIGETKRASYTANLGLAESLILLMGADYKEESFESSFDLPTQRSQMGYFAEFQTEFFEDLYVNLGVRYDDNDSFGKFTSYRFAAAKIFSFDRLELKLKSSAGNGFRAPSLYELASNNGPFAGSPATDNPLKEEISEGYDAGVELFFSHGLHVDVVYFNQKTKDKIYYDNVSFSGYLQDEGLSRSKGIEASIELPITESIVVTSNYTHNTAKEADGSTRIRRPKNLANVKVSASLMEEKLLLGVMLRYSGKFEDIGAADADSYQVADISAHYNLLDNLNIFCKINNLSGEEYVEVSGYNTAGRSGYIGINYQF